MTSTLVVFLCGVLVSAFLGYLFSSRSSNKVIIRDVTIAAVVGPGLLTLVMLQFELNNLRDVTDKLLEPNKLEQLNNFLGSMPDDTHTKDLISERKKKLEIELAALLNGRIDLVSEYDVVKAWSRLFGEADNSVLATNFVTPQYWLEESAFSKKQHGIQDDAIKRGVKIRRIFIRESDSIVEVTAIKSLLDQQKEIGIQARVLTHSKLSMSAAWGKYASSLSGALDFVLFDYNVVLLTQTNFQSRQIQSGTLTSEREITDAARNLFEALWEISDEKL